MDLNSGKNEWVDIYEDVQNIKIDETNTEINEQNNNEQQTTQNESEEIIDNIVADIVDNSLENTELYINLEDSSKNIEQENQNDNNDNNDLYYDIFRLISIIAGCKVFFEILEWAN